MKYFLKCVSIGVIGLIIFAIFMLGLGQVFDFLGSHLSQEVKGWLLLSVLLLPPGTALSFVVGFAWLESLSPKTAPEAPSSKKRARKKSNA